MKLKRLTACGLNWASMFGLALWLACTGAIALSTVPPGGLVLSINVVPRTAALGAPRSIFVHGASGTVSVDESALATTGTLVIRMTPEIVGLLAVPQILTYTPRTLGNVRIMLKLLDGPTAEAPMETVALARSTVNLDGMWFDPATNGSGVSFHHAASSDVVFGTWFLYGSPTAQQPIPSPRWYSLQNLRWVQNGALLTGIIYQGRANDVKPSCTSGDDCPRPAVELRTVGSVSVSLIDQNNMRIEAFDQYGRSVFLSSLKRLSP
ncbi:MAG: hypothetical protein ABL931_02555 [Usitatibacteraceae bacterium]